ncbi:thymidine phosphorylase [Cloacibacillus sp. An23]|uniref:thymidine phosphorylase n=1 Tax=Cloacibacillus sp. An23 TaxID=1965591 RepID=UPI000B387806|nr:thymidine phosphorylase [Cloacibacillus sp. An23]OUO91895.1 thymidine phosphorylase [Cloacibacillus sp. An23]
MLSMIDFIEKKRDGGSHSREELQSFVRGVMDGSVPDYQSAAWLMAVYFRGLDEGELVSFTEALADSGDRYSFPPELHVVDKHSTGGVGDKTTLVLLPLAAACGARLSKLSGPGLGFTGGTVDKFESIPGMRMHLTPEEFSSQMKKIGCAISGHSLRLAPAEGKFYSLRDVTGTVPSVQLVASSIISKKLVGGASGFVFDVKCGGGAFMETEAEARALAKELVALSKKFGKKAAAVITGMEQPLGEWVGNAAEVYEAVEVLRGRGPADTTELCVELCALMLEASGVAKDKEEGAALAAGAIESGRALDKLAEIIAAQGGDAAVVDRPLDILPRAPKAAVIKSGRDGVLSELHARPVGEALRALGGGRMKLGDAIDHSAAIRLAAKIGGRVEKGSPLIEIYCKDDTKLPEALACLDGCWKVSETAEKPKLVIDVIY